MSMAIDYSQGSAMDIFNAALNEAGLGSLSGAAYEQFQRDPNLDHLNVWLRSTPEYKYRFPYMEQLRKEGRAITEGQAIAYERAVKQAVSAAGLPPGVFDTRDYINGLILQDKSYNEVEHELTIGLKRALDAPPEVKAAFAEQLGHDGIGALAAWFIDPKRTEAEIEAIQARAQTVGRGRAFGLQIDGEQAAQFALGMSDAEIQQRLAQAAQLDPLTRATVNPNDTSLTDTSLTKDTFTGVTAPISKALDERSAEFGGDPNAGATLGSQGTTGFGSARGT